MEHNAEKSRVQQVNTQPQGMTAHDTAIQEHTAALVRVSDTVTIVPQDLAVIVPAVPAHLVIVKICRILCDYAVFYRNRRCDHGSIVDCVNLVRGTNISSGNDKRGTAFQAHPRILLIGDPASKEEPCDENHAEPSQES